MFNFFSFITINILIILNIYTYCNFDLSYQRYGLEYSVDNYLQIDLYQKRYAIAKNLYNKNIYDLVKIHGNIPKIIHQVWLGKPMPEELISLTDKWKNLSGWEYKLWSEKEIEKLELENKDLYELAINYGEKADIVRLEILKKYGGIYVDADYEYVNISNLEKMIDSYDIILGLEPIAHGVVVGNAFIAASKNHPFINKIISELRDNFFKYESRIAMLKTGPYFLTKKVFENIDLIKGGILLPPTYLYPLMAHFSEFNYLKDFREIYIKEETIGIHYWTSLWINSEGIKNVHVSKDN